METPFVPSITVNRTDFTQALLFLFTNKLSYAYKNTIIEKHLLFYGSVEFSIVTSKGTRKNSGVAAAIPEF